MILQVRFRGQFRRAQPTYNWARHKSMIVALLYWTGFSALNVFYDTLSWIEAEVVSVARGILRARARAEA